MKIALCTPSSGNCRAEYVESLINGAFNLPKEHEYMFFRYSSSVIPHNRNVIVNQSLEWGADKIFFIDDDMRFPDSAMATLITSSVKYPIIAANCVKRQIPFEYLAEKNGKMWDSRRSSIQFSEVDYVGNAFIIYDAEVFKEVPKPWWAFEYIPELDIYDTEDCFFQRKAKNLGYKVIVDNFLSKQISHMGIAEFRP